MNNSKGGQIAEPQQPELGNGLGKLIPADQLDSTPAISLRDYFAGQALSGMLANQYTKAYADAGMEAAARMCYVMADKMILASSAKA